MISNVQNVEKRTCSAANNDGLSKDSVDLQRHRQHTRGVDVERARRRVARLVGGS